MLMKLLQKKLQSVSYGAQAPRSGPFTWLLFGLYTTAGVTKVVDTLGASTGSLVL